MARFIDELKRSHHCAELREADVGKEVVLFGWVASYRDHGRCVFVDLRDREGVTQLVFDPEAETKADGHSPKDAHDSAQQLRSEWVIGIRGRVVSRGGNKNPRLDTGDIEVMVVELVVFNKSDTPPFEITDTHDLDPRARLEEGAQTVPQDGVVVDQEHPHELSPPSRSSNARDTLNADRRCSRTRRFESATPR